MKLSKEVVLGSVIGLSLVLSGCDQSEKEPVNTPENEQITAAQQTADVLPYLNIQEQPAKCNPLLAKASYLHSALRR